MAASYDYYYVPAVFMGQIKLFEGRPQKQDMEDVLAKALASRSN